MIIKWYWYTKCIYEVKLMLSCIYSVCYTCMHVSPIHIDIKGILLKENA